MNFPIKLDPRVVKAFKIAGLALGGLIAVAVVLALVNSSLRSLNRGDLMTANVVTMPAAAPGYGGSVSGGPAYDYKMNEAVGLSTRNAAQAVKEMAPAETSGPEDNALETTSYSANIETRDLDRTCAAVADLKSRPEVIFETADKYDKGCNYRFKVAKAAADQILAVIKDLKPKDLSTNTQSLKKLVDDYTSETDILKQRLAANEETMTKTLAAYDEISAVATKAHDAESLAKIVDSKTNLIERLTQERLDVNAQLARLQREKELQLDRVTYTYFNINVVEDKFIDFKAIKDSWKAAVRNFFSSLNEILQGLTINVAVIILLIIQYALYLLIILLTVKYGWRLVKYLWKK